MTELVVKRLEQLAEGDVTGQRQFFYYGEERRAYTYREFNEIVNRIAHSFRSLGIRKGDRVSVFLKNAWITSLVMFGIWKAGAVYSPINFNYTGRLLIYQIQDTEPKILVTERRMVPAINEVAQELPPLRIVVYDPAEGDHDFDPDIAGLQVAGPLEEIPFGQLLHGDPRNPEVDLEPWDIANIIYTSGTTGLPKGVVQTYRWIYGYTYLGAQMLNEEDVIYNDLPMYHVGGAFANVAKAVFAGCQAAVWDKFSVSQFWDRIRESGATNAILLDVMIPWLMKAGEKASDRRNTLNKVYMQPLPQYHHQVARRFGFDFVLAGFGQTESGHGFSAVIEECGPGEGTPADLYRGYPREVLLDICRQHGVPVVDGRRELKKGFMGKPSKFMEAAILNEQDEECPPGQVGEIAFRPRLPHLLMREYFRKPEETVRAFRNLWFHTGDAGYRDEDGNFFFVDRLGSVVRHRGEKFSSYQVEDLLLQHPAVEMCAAFPVPAEEGDEDDLAAYLVLKEGAALTEDELRGWMASHMPKFMQPRYVRFVKDIPRTPTNKVEKYKLRNQLLKEISAGEGGRKRS